MNDIDLRDDLKIIADLVPKNARVLEIGCCQGDLLHYLTKYRNVDGRGIEIKQSNVSKCVKSGLAVIQGDADIDLKFYPDKCFDYVISSQVLQATRFPYDVLVEMLRIGKKVAVAIPNFGHWYNRLYLLTKGRMPVSKSLAYQWYETPNIHFSTLKDFDKLCKDLNCQIENKKFFSSFSSNNVNILPNLMSETGIFILSS